MNLKSTYIYARFLTLIILTHPLMSDEDCSTDCFDFDTIQLTEDATSATKDLPDAFDTLVADITIEDLNHVRSCGPTEAVGWLLAIANFNLATILDQAIYKKTTPPVSRNLINYPNVQLCTYQTPLYNGQITTHLFFNQTTKKAFTTNPDEERNDRIGSYLNIENKTLLTVLDQMFESSSFPDEVRRKFSSLDTALIARTLGNARLEERRIGGMLHAYQEFATGITCEAKLPIYWMIRNLNFTKNDKDILDQQISVFLTQSSADSFDEDTFSRKHLIMDAFGSGTLELSLSKKAFEGDKWSLDIGGGLLIPTDIRFATGWYGTYFEPKDQQPILEFCSVADLNNKTLRKDGLQTLQNYFVGALDHLSSMLLACELGYTKHFGFVFKAAPHWEIKPGLEYKGLYNLEILLPHEEKRFFVPLNTGTFSQDYADLPQSTDQEQQAKLRAIEQRITTLLFPRVQTAKIFPGVVFTSTSCLKKSYRLWDFTAGYNGWYKSAEKLLHLDTNLKDLNISKSINDSVYSVKLFGKIHRTFNTKRHNDFSLSLWGDWTVFNHGTGNDFSVGISLDCKI